ncbi:MAG: LPS assembly protein LptD [Planctomycetes bacterium]|nr:LPS assembly protein LptD [Planctomycetota bacterium]
MVTSRKIGWVFLVCCVCGVADAQQRAPVADRVDEAMLPYDLSELPIKLNGKLGYFFQDEDGTDAVHMIGDFELVLGDAGGQVLRSQEAVVWLTPRTQQGRDYRQVEVFLWRDAEVYEVGHTVTAGPALFVTLNSFGDVVAAADDVALRSSAHTMVYGQGNAIRQMVAQGPRREEEGASPLLIVDASGISSREDENRPVQRSPILARFGEMSTANVDGKTVIVVVGGAYLSRGDDGWGGFFELKADSIVAFLPSSEEAALRSDPTAAVLGGTRGSSSDTPEAARRTQSSPQDSSSGGQILSAGIGDFEVEGVYLEGDVVMSSGPTNIRAERLYYDFVTERAFILDAVIRTALADRNVPLYVRADEIRQRARGHFLASHAILTTSEFHTPHYHVGASRVELIDRTPPDPSAASPAVRAGSFRIHDATLNLKGHPVAYWPYIRGRVDTSETAIRNLRTGYSDDFGLEVETGWHLFNVLGLETPTGFDATFGLDYFSKRGPAAGVDAKYQRDRYFGLVRSYLMQDRDEDFLGRERETPSPQDIRGRILVRHRQYLEDDWQLSLELAYISDEGFLEEFFESEFDNGKEQETLLYLKKQRANWALTANLQSRLLDFYTQTEHLPDFGFFWLGEPCGDRATWFSENRAGVVRYRPENQTFRELLRDGRLIASDTVLRADTRQELELPTDWGPLRFVPFVAGRGTTWSNSPKDGSITRGLGSVGVRGSMYFSRTTPEYQSRFFDIDGVRHIIKPDLTAWLGASNRDHDELFLFDETVEGLEGSSGVSVGLRQRWQTKRGAGPTRRIVDLLTFDVEAGAFSDIDGRSLTNGFTSYSRPENSIARNHVNSSLIWRVNDRTALLSELNFDVNDGEIDILNLSLAVERSPRLSYLVGYRFIEEGNSNLLGFDMSYHLTEKHMMAARELFDLGEGQTLDFTIAFIRKFPRWFGAVAFQLDEAEDDFGVSFTIWPEGLPQAALGSRRFTGLAGAGGLTGR